MHVVPLKAPIVRVGDCLEKVLESVLPPLQEEDIVLITSKIVSLAKGFVVPKDQIPSKMHLVRQQADAYLSSENTGSYQGGLTIKDHMLIPAAGIDESNAEADYYIVFPARPFDEANDICAYLKRRHHVQRIGVILTDSRTTPLRRGVTGVALAWSGIQPYKDQRGKSDLFGRPLKVTTINVVDALATAAVFTMGEGNEQMPLALIRKAPHVEFTAENQPFQGDESFFIPLEEDIYAPLLTQGKWIWKNKVPEA